jgi:DNA-directed RNA polymerase subunit RPC12/RpoP
MSLDYSVTHVPGPYRLGSYLHAQVAADLKESKEIDIQELRNRLRSTIAAIDEYVANPVIGNFGLRCHFTCPYCKTLNVMGANRLSDGVPVACRRANCGATFTVHDLASGTPEFRPNEVSWACPKCGQHQYLGAHLLEAGLTVVCSYCETRLVIRYTIVPAEDPAQAGA